MATVEQRKRVARYLRGCIVGMDEEYTELARAVADELDPPAPRTVVINGVRFWYDRGWHGWRDDVDRITDTLVEMLWAFDVNATPDEYATLYALQDGV